MIISYRASRLVVLTVKRQGGGQRASDERAPFQDGPTHRTPVLNRQVKKMRLKTSLNTVSYTCALRDGKGATMADISKGANKEASESEGFKSSGGARLSDEGSSKEGLSKQVGKKLGISKLLNRDKEAK